MAFTIILVTVLMVTVANAGFSAWDDENYPSWNPGAFASSFASSGFNIPRPVFPPNFPFTNFNFPPIPPMPPMPPIPTVQIPSFQDIATAGNKPGFNGIAVASHSTAQRGENGEIIRDGGTTIVTNQNGEVTVEKLGTGGPGGTIIYTQRKNPPFAEYKPPQFKAPHFKPIRMPKMDHFTMRPFESMTFKPFKPISADEIRNYVPGENEQFVGHSSHVETYYSDVNGKKTSGGSRSEIQNNNGRVKEDDVAFRQDPPE